MEPSATPSATAEAASTTTPAAPAAVTRTATPLATATAAEPYPVAEDVIDRRQSDGFESIDFLWRDDPLADAERCVAAHADPVRCFAFRTLAAHSASALGTGDDIARPTCWDGFASTAGGADGRASAPTAPPRGTCPQDPLGLPDGFWPVVVPAVDSELVLQPDGALRLVEVVQIVSHDSLCAAALAEVTGACATVEASELTVFFEPVIIEERVHLMPLVWDFRVLVVAPDSCYTVDVFPNPELALDEWFTASLRLGLQFG